MSKFQDGFFQDLWCDMVLREADSIYCRFLLEEKKEQAYLAEHEEKKEKMTQKQSEKKSGTRARKVSKEHACVEILRVCQRRKKQKQISEAENQMFLELLKTKIEEAKVNQKRKKCVLEVLEQSENVTGKGIKAVLDLCLYADAVQFFYNAGYPLPMEERKKNEAETLIPKKTREARIKTLPLNLLDFYFEQRGLPFEKISYLSRMSPERVIKDEVLKEKLADVYEFACTNQMTRAVVPLLLDAETGKGLYVLGEAYLQQWDFQESEQEKVEEILNGECCCYAIVQFLNLELEDNGAYCWSPYSIVDMEFGKSDTNPELILFHDLEKALNVYKGQLSISSDEILYENFKEENTVYVEEEAVSIAPEFLKYFRIISKDKGLESYIEELKNEYQKNWKED